jgi:UDP-glucose 4-epimerase
LDLKDKRVIVTGGAGFIGSHLVDRLSGIAGKTIIYDSFDEYYTGKERNILQHYKNPRVSILRADILDVETLKHAMDGVDVVFHLAAQPGVRFSQQNPEKTNLVNTTGTLNLLTAAKRSRVERVVFASSSSVYGEPLYLPVDEEHPCHPISVYGSSKVAAEHYCRIYYDLYDLPVVILRYHTVYGPRQRPDMAIHKWTKSLLEGQPAVIFGDGEQTRDFTYIDDIVEGTLMAAETDGIEGEVFNLGNGSRETINHIVKLIMELTDREDLEPIHEQEKLGDVLHTQADTTKAERLLQYKPRTDLRDGLSRFIEWYVSIHGEVSEKRVDPS